MYIFFVLMNKCRIFRKGLVESLFADVDPGFWSGVLKKEFGNRILPRAPILRSDSFLVCADGCSSRWFLFFYGVFQG